jgi:RNA recognition motif-containing protein
VPRNAEKEHADKMADRRKYRDEKERDGVDIVKPKLDEPPNSRLFIVCNKTITEEEFRTAFEKYGTIEEIWVVRDRSTGEPKGEVAHKLMAGGSECRSVCPRFYDRYYIGHLF